VLPSAIPEFVTSGLGDQTYTQYKFKKELTNTPLTWEKSKSWNFGLDASVLNGRVDVSAEYYITNTDGVIWNQAIPVTNGGYSSTEMYTMYNNIAETRNHGFELTAIGRPFTAKKKGDFEWTTTVTFSVNKNEVISLGDGAADFIANGTNTNDARTKWLHIGDMYIMRMAEIYLLAAETEQMLGNGSKAAEYLNVLRKRAARSTATESQWKLASATEDDIFDEYAREMAGEFSRWALLKRHNAFETRLEKYNKRAAKSFKPYHYNRPISAEFLSTILNSEEYGDNGYGQTSNSGIENFK